MSGATLVSQFEPLDFLPVIGSSKTPAVLPLLGSDCLGLHHPSFMFPSSDYNQYVAERLTSDRREFTD
jgi:hypothetical protein